MQSSMNQYKLVWQCTPLVNEKTLKMNALVWNKGRWSLHLFPMTKTLRRSIDAAQARFLRRILKIPAAYISRVSHKEIRCRCSTSRFSTYGPYQIQYAFQCGVAGTFHLFSFFRLRTVVVVGSLYWARSRLQPSTFRIFFRLTSKAFPP